MGENMMASEQQCRKVADELYMEHIRGRLNDKDYETFEALRKDWEFVRNEYIHTAVGPAQSKVMAEFMMSRMADSMQQLVEDFRRKPIAAKPKTAVSKPA